MEKIRRFLGVLASLFVLIFAGNALAAGYDCPENRKYTSCNENYYMSGGTNVGNNCDPCGENSTSPGGTQSYCLCDRGYTIDGDLSNSAMLNKRSTSGQDCKLSAILCETGTYLPADGLRCSECPEGSYCPGSKYYYNASEDQGINTCPTGYTSPAGAYQEKSCYIDVPGGSILTTAGSTSFESCQAGTFKAAHQVFYGDTSPACEVCGDNTYSDDGAASCIACLTDAGYGNSGDTQGDHAGVASCKTTCDPTEAVKEANAACAVVDAGDWATGGVVSQGETSVLDTDYGDCPTGYTDGNPAASLSGCVKNIEDGYYLANEYDESPAQCAAGTYKTAHTVTYGNTSTCNMCDAGEYSDPGATQCKTCNTGYTTPDGHAGVESCKITCDAGTYVATAGEQCVSLADKGGYYIGNHTVSQGNVSTPLQCPDDWRDGPGTTAESECQKVFTVTGKQKEPELVTGAVSQETSACEPDNWQCTQKYGAAGDGDYVGECKTVDELSCTKSVASVVCEANRYASGITCPACEDGYTAPQGSTNPNQCTMACNVPCTDPGQGACPEHAASCTWNTEEFETGIQNQVDKECSVSAKQCSLAGVVCDAGYDVSLDGLSCTAHAYKVSYSCGTGATGNAPGGSSQLYAENYEVKGQNTCKRPGFTFGGWSDGLGETFQPSTTFNWEYTTDINFTAVWEPCDKDTGASGTCDCSATQYPNGNGCTSCFVQCSGEFSGDNYDVCSNETTADCQRACVAADVPNAVTVSGYMTQGKGDTCVPTQCKSGFYVLESACQACPENSNNCGTEGSEDTFTCDDGYHLSDNGLTCEPDEYTITLNKNQGTGTAPASKTCLHGVPCELPREGVERTGYAFTGWGADPSCESGVFQEVFMGSATRYACWTQTFYECVAGKYYDESGVLQNCKPGDYCPGTGNVQVGQSGCNVPCGNGATSPASASDKTQCYITCQSSDITGGELSPINAQMNWNGSEYPSCTYTADCDAGYVAINQSSASASCTPCEDGVICSGGTGTTTKECTAGDYCEGGIAKTCPPVGTGVGWSDEGAGSIEECYDACIIELNVDNAYSVTSDGRKYYDVDTGGYPTCTYNVVCNADYEVQENHTAVPWCKFVGECQPGQYCPPDGSEPQQCIAPGTSDGTATSQNGCYVECDRVGYITGGTLTSNASDTDDRQYWDGAKYPTCTYTATCEAGYVAVNQNTINATCEMCEAGVNCPGGTDSGEPEDCPEGSYCEEGKGPQVCPGDGSSAAGAESVTDCFVTCPATKPVANAVGGVANSDGPAYYNGSGYNQCTYTVQCNENYVASGNGTANPVCEFGDPTQCPEDHYCPGDGTVYECPDGGMTDGTGAVSPTQCYKIFEDYDGFDNGVASAKCNWHVTATDYISCSIQKVKSCDAGYYYKTQNAFLCESTETGFYSPYPDTEQTKCPVNPTGGIVESSENADSYTDCYMACDLDVEHASSVAAKDNTVFGISKTEYAACSYAVTCNTGYTVQDNNSDSPTCVANRYTVTLDKNGGTGSTPASIECVFDSGACELPANDVLTRPGYSGQNKWCKNKDGTGTCYYAGQSTNLNISENGTNVTLYAVWMPNVYAVTLDHQDADTNGAPSDVYLKYATGWFSNSAATSDITALTTVPSKTGYEFAGYYSATSGGVQLVNAAGAFQTNENALTFTTDDATIFARWSAGTTNCAPGTYYTGNGSECAPCEANHYCPGGDFATDTGTAEGHYSCPENGLSVSNSESVTACYKTKLAYSATNGSGTQTCNWDDAAKSYSASCRDIAIDSCVAGYWLESNDDTDCVAVGRGYYSGDDVTTRNQCPNGGNTESETATKIQDCFKTEIPYTAMNGAGTQRCFYTSGDGIDAVYQRDCDTWKIETCRGGYWLANSTDKDCSVVGNNYYSNQNDTERHLCPAGGKTDTETAEDIKLCNQDGLPYQAEHGAGENKCFYTSGEGDSAIYESSCQDVTMTSCDAGYYFDRNLTETDCVPVGRNYYSPAVDMARHECPLGGVTNGTTSGASSDCYRTDMACDITNGSGQQTCNYDESDADYTLNCQTCTVIACDEGFSQVGNTCIDCPEGSVCDEGTEKTCASLTGGLYPNSDAGTEDVAMCWRECAMVANALEMSGRDYYGAPDTCQVTRCQVGYTLENGACTECPEGSFCDGTIDPDPDVPGQDVKSCADLGNGEWPLSLPGATDASQCYHTCEEYDVINGTAVPVSDKAFYPNECEYQGQSESGNPCEIVDGVCIEKSCNAGYEMIDGVCEPCNREHALSYKDGGVCQIAVCASGYHPNGDRCEYNIQECSAPNAVYAEVTWDFNKKSFGSCMIKECEYGYHVSSNACVSDVQPCNVENGVGFKEWNHDINGWGECVATQCDPGYTSDPSLTNDHTKQCGECKNKYGANGTVAVSSYVQECEIASCMDQGELYNLEYGECVQICPFEEYSDETGTMVWDESRKKCVRTCNEGFTMW